MVGKCLGGGFGWWGFCGVCGEGIVELGWWVGEWVGWGMGLIVEDGLYVCMGMGG